MPRLQVIVDGETRFDQDVPDRYLPAENKDYAKALGVLDQSHVTPLMRLGALTNVIELMRRVLQSHPHLKPCDVSVITHGPGKATIDIDMAMPSL
jgi:hypothetical protein